jgi:hypothetical protein
MASTGNCRTWLPFTVLYLIPHLLGYSMFEVSMTEIHVTIIPGGITNVIDQPSAPLKSLSPNNNAARVAGA